MDAIRTTPIQVRLSPVFSAMMLPYFERLVPEMRIIAAQTTNWRHKTIDVTRLSPQFNSPNQPRRASHFVASRTGVIVMASATIKIQSSAGMLKVPKTR